MVDEGTGRCDNSSTESAGALVQERRAVEGQPRNELCSLLATKKWFGALNDGHLLHGPTLPKAPQERWHSVELTANKEGHGPSRCS